MNRRSPRSVRLLAILLFAVLALTRPDVALGQGTQGTLPEPLGLREASDLIARYGTLDAENRVAIEAAHDRYLEAYERFRDDEVAEFLSLMQQAQGGAMPDLPLLDRFLKEWSRVREKAGRIDEGFFVEAGSLLGPDSAEAVDRARRVRGRQRQIASAGMFGGGGGAGRLDEMFWRLPPTAEEVAACDDVLRAYESAMPALCEDLAEASVGMIRSIAVNFAEQGLTDLRPEDMQDPARMEQVMAAVQAAMAAASAESLEASRDAEDREIVAARGLRDRLDPERWWRLKRAWMSSAFPMSGLGWSGGVASSFPKHAATILEDIVDPTSRETATGIRDAWYRADDRTTDDLVEVGRDAAAIQLTGDFEALADDPGVDLRERRSTAANEAIEAMLALVEDDTRRTRLRDRIAADPGSFMNDGEFMDLAVGGPVAAGTEDLVEVEGPLEGWSPSNASHAASHGIPGPIRPREFDLMVAMLELDETERQIADVLLKDHLAAWSERVSPILDGVREQERNLYRNLETDDLEASWRSCEQAFETVLALDEAFLADVEATFWRDDRAAALAAIRVQRAFDRVETLEGGGGFQFGTPVVEPVSPFALVDELELDADARVKAMAAAIAAHAALDRAVDGWERFRFDARRREATTEYEARRLRQAVGEMAEEDRIAAMAAEGQRWLQAWMARSEERRVDSSRRRAIVERVVEDEVIPVLEPLPAMELRLAMLEQGFTTGDDAASALQLMRRVLRLRDLDDGQVAVIETLVADQLAVELDLVESMAAASMAVGDLVVDEQAAFQQQMLVQQEVEKFQFRRDEMRERLIQRLLAVLEPGQVARIPALAERADG